MSHSSSAMNKKTVFKYYDKRGKIRISCDLGGPSSACSSRSSATSYLQPIDAFNNEACQCRACRPCLTSRKFNLPSHIQAQEYVDEQRRQVYVGNARRNNAQINLETQRRDRILNEYEEIGNHGPSAPQSSCVTAPDDQPDPLAGAHDALQTEITRLSEILDRIKVSLAGLHMQIQHALCQTRVQGPGQI